MFRLRLILALVAVVLFALPASGALASAGNASGFLCGVWVGFATEGHPNVVRTKNSTEIENFQNGTITDTCMGKLAVIPSSPGTHSVTNCVIFGRGFGRGTGSVTVAKDGSYKGTCTKGAG